MAVAGVAFALGVNACGGSTGPGTSGLTIERGGGQSDTILSTLAQALIVRLREPGGVGGHVVQFSSIDYAPTASNPYGGVYAYVRRLDSDFPATFAVDTTTSAGHASIHIVLGTLAGPAPIIVAVPDFGIVDTVRFTVLPGRAVGIQVAPSDTALMVGGTATIRGGAVDAYGNVLPDPVTFSVVSGPITVSGATVTGTAIGRATFLATTNGASDNGFISVVPPGVLAAVTASGLAIFNLDGSNFQIVPGSSSQQVGNVRWSPSGAGLVFDHEFSGTYEGGTTTLSLITPSGTVTTLDNPSGTFDRWPQWSRDGSTIYFAQQGSGSALWQVTPTGSGDDSLPNQNPSFDSYPSPSPDGTRLAYFAYNGHASDLRIMTIATGAVADLHIVAWAPVWAPVGDTIAFLNQTNYTGQIALVNADGSGQRTVNMQNYNQNFDWSPDGRYIVASNFNGSLDIINVATGATLPLAYTSGFYSPTWQPASGAGAARVPRLQTFSPGSHVRHAR